MESFAPLPVMIGFKDKVQSFPLLVRWCVLINMPHNYNGTWQRYNRAVCFSKHRKITVTPVWVEGGSELRSKPPILNQLNYVLILNTIISYNL
jgi:hypothetical protein